MRPEGKLSEQDWFIREILNKLTILNPYPREDLTPNLINGLLDIQQMNRLKEILEEVL